MHFFYRKQYLSQIKTLLETEKLILLIGARQVGKTTILNILMDEIYNSSKLYINFEDFFGQTFVSKKEFINWLQFEYNFDIYSDGYLFLDEIQVLESPDSLLKSLYDDNKIKSKIITTGSRFWGQKNIGSSLVGRGEIMKIMPFSFSEFVEVKGKNIQHLRSTNYNLIKSYLNEYLQFGGYPSVVFAKSKDAKINETKKIIERFFEKDLMYFMNTKDLISFKKVFQFLSLNIGNTIKIDHIASQFSLGRYKVQQFLKFLVDSFLIYEVFPYFTDKSKEYNRHPEVFFNDVGIINYISGNYEISINKGKIIENFVYLQLRENKNVKETYYYNKTSGSEIDFIVEYNNGLLTPIEVKSNDKCGKPKIFSSFNKDYSDRIQDFIVTSQGITKTNKISDKTLSHIPYWLIGNHMN